MFPTLCQARSSDDSGASTPCSSPTKKSRTETGKVGAVTGKHRSTSLVKFKEPVEDTGRMMPSPGGVKEKIQGASLSSKVKAPTKPQPRASAQPEAAAKTGGAGVTIDLSGSQDPVQVCTGKVTPSTVTSIVHMARGNDRGLVIGGNLLCGRGLGKNVSRIERPKPPTPQVIVSPQPQAQAQVQFESSEVQTKPKTVSTSASVCPTTSTSMAMVPRHCDMISGTTSSSSGTFSESSGLHLVPYNPATTGATENRMVIYTPPGLASGSVETIGSGETSATPRITSTPPGTTPLSQARTGTPPGSSPPTQGSSTVTGNISPAPTVPYHISGEFLPFVPPEYIMSDDTSISDSESDRSCGWYPHRRCGPMSDEDLRERARFEMTLEHDASGMDPECRPPWTESEVEMWIYRHFPLWSYDHWLGPPLPDHDASGFSPDSDVDMEPTPSDLGSGSPRASLSCPSSDSEREASGEGAPRPVPPRYPDPLRCFCDPRLPDGIVRKNVCSFCYELAFPLQDLTL